MPRDIATGNAALAKAIIAEVGSDFLQKTFKRSPSAISMWKHNGLPLVIEMYMSQTYPNLRAFGGKGILGISRP